MTILGKIEPARSIQNIFIYTLNKNKHKIREINSQWNKRVIKIFYNFSVITKKYVEKNNFRDVLHFIVHMRIKHTVKVHLREGKLAFFGLSYIYRI